MATAYAPRSRLTSSNDAGSFWVSAYPRSLARIRNDQKVAAFLDCRLTEYVKMLALIPKQKLWSCAADREKLARVRETILRVCHRS